MDANTIDTCITKPTPNANIWKEIFRVLKPGSMLIAINSTGFHRTTCNIEDAGFEIRDTIHIIKSHNSELAVLAMKPTEGTFVANAQKWNVAGLNIDACRIPHTTVSNGNLADNPHLRKSIAGGNGGRIITTETERRFNVQHEGGRWPSNVILMHNTICHKTGTVKIKNRSGDTTGEEASYTGGPGTHCYGEFKRIGWQKYGNADGYEEIDRWECHELCPIRRVNEQVGIRPGCQSPSKAKPQSKFRPDQGNYMPQGQIHSDSGYASRYYFQATDELDVLIYFCKLTSTPFESTVLDPFGDDGIRKAALFVGRKFVENC